MSGSETKFLSKPWPIEFKFTKYDNGESPVLTRHEERQRRGGRRNSQFNWILAIRTITIQLSSTGALRGAT